jgi:hypothetical protein
MQAPAKPVAPYVQPRLTTNDTTVRGGPRHIDDKKQHAASPSLVTLQKRQSKSTLHPDREKRASRNLM